MLQKTVISCETYIGAQVQTLCNFQPATLTHPCSRFHIQHSVILISSSKLYIQEKDTPCMISSSLCYVKEQTLLVMIFCKRQAVV